MRIGLAFLLLGGLAAAEPVRVLVDGAGCRTRQLAMQRIWTALPGVEQVRILPRKNAPADNQRYFVVRTRPDAGTPTARQLQAALGRRAEHYRVLRVETVAQVKARTREGHESP